MPYNTTAIPPRKEPTGQNQLPLSRVKKIISQDPDVHLCSNNAAFVITLAAEMFVQQLADESHTQAKLERKPRRNIQYKDVANAIAHKDHLEFLEDVVPKTVPYKKIKAAAEATQARLRVEQVADENGRPRETQQQQSQRPSTQGSGSAIVNGDSKATNPLSLPARGGSAAAVATSITEDDPNEQLEMEMRQAQQDGDVQMSG